MKEEMAKHEGKPDNEIQEIMVPKYNEFLTTVLKTVPGGLPAGTSSKNSSLSACQRTDVKAKERRGPTRRRSFGQEDKKTKAATEMAVSQSETTLPEVAVAPAPAEKDSWDSVSEQPYCPVCCMGFKTPAQLERHIQYSDLHAKQVAKLEKEGEPLAPGASPLRTDKTTSMPAQEEGTHYRLMYSGSKLFWRTSTNIDFDIYLHVISNCIEVIGHDSNRSLELNRLYLDYRKLLMNVENAVAANLAEKRKEQIKDKFVKLENIMESVMLEEARQLACVSFILNRVQYTAGDSSLSLAVHAGDVAENAPLLPQPPVTLIPITVNRRRKTSSEEIAQTISGLQTDYADLKAATQRAEKISTLVFESANMLTSLVTKKVEDTGSKWARMWRWAIRLQIRRNHVAKMTIIIEEWEAKQQAKKAAEKLAVDKQIAKVGAPIGNAAGGKKSTRATRRSYGEVGVSSKRRT